MYFFFSPTFIWECTPINDTFRANMSTDKCVLNKRQIYSPSGLTLPPRCTFVVRSLLIISSRDCREADSRDTSPRHACLGEVSRKIWLHDFAINNNGGSVPVIFISLEILKTSVEERVMWGSVSATPVDTGNGTVAG